MPLPGTNMRAVTQPSRKASRKTSDKTTRKDDKPCWTSPAPISHRTTALGSHSSRTFIVWKPPLLRCPRPVRDRCFRSSRQVDFPDLLPSDITIHRVHIRLPMPPSIWPVIESVRQGQAGSYSVEPVREPSILLGMQRSVAAPTYPQP